jgi:exonuclease 3'-5' domain-containing protein 1
VYLTIESSGRKSALEAVESSSLVTSFENLDLKVDQSREFIDTESKIASLVAKLQDLPTKPPSLYIDLEGINLSRHGRISILQIYVLPLDETYLVDICSLQERALLAMASHKGRNLLGILESPDIPKVFFDVRNDSDALFTHFNVQLAGVVDLQLMQLATSSFPRKYVSGLEKCLEREAFLTAHELQIWRASKEKGLKLFDPKRGGKLQDSC